MFRMVYTADNGDVYTSDVSSGLSNIGSPNGIEFFRMHKGVKVHMEVGHYCYEKGDKGYTEAVWKCDLVLG